MENKDEYYDNDII